MDYVIRPIKKPVFSFSHSDYPKAKSRKPVISYLKKEVK